MPSRIAFFICCLSTIALILAPIAAAEPLAPPTLAASQPVPGAPARILLSDAQFIGTGQPLNEAVASHGPFVMSNETQLLEAFRDYQMGKMGVLIEA